MRKRQSSKRRVRNANSPKTEKPPDIKYTESLQKNRLQKIKRTRKMLLILHQDICEGNNFLYCGMLSRNIALLKKEEEGIKFLMKNSYESAFKEVQKVKIMIEKLENLVCVTRMEEQKKEFFLNNGHIYTLKQLNSGSHLFEHILKLEYAYLQGLSS